MPCIVGCWGYYLPQMGLAKMKRQARTEDQLLYAQAEQVLAKFRRMATETLDMKAGGLSAAAMLMTSAESEYRQFEKAVDGLAAAVDERGRSAAAGSMDTGSGG